MRNKLNREIVSVLYKHIPQTKELAHLLMEILDLGKESVYRRLRSEVPFTFDEVCTIAIKLDISVDGLIGLKNPECAIFNMHIYKSTELAEIYQEILKENINSIHKVSSAKSSKISTVLNRLPYGITLYQKSMVKFYYYKWFFHMQKGEMDISFKDFKVPDKILEQCNIYLHESERIANCEMDIIVDENVFLYMIKEINYFRRRGLIKEDDIPQLQNDLRKIVDLTDIVTKIGTTEYGSKLRFYLSAIDIEPNFSYVEYDETTCIQFWTPSSEIITSYNLEVCKRKKEWIESLKRYTTLITQCNEKQQVEYLNAQRVLIENMVNNIY